MKKVIEKIKDILYDTFDYLVMIGIIVAVVVIIGWRLDVLFASDVKVIPGTEIHTVEESGNKSEEGAKEDTDKEEADETLEEPEDLPPLAEEPPTKPTQASGEMVNINIPAGSYPGKIGTILLDAGLIDSSKNFIAKAVELGLETKLKSGTYSIPKGSSYEQVITILTK